MTSLSSVFHAATRNANSGNDLAGAAGQIIAKRVALGMAAALDPLRADYREFGRMVPEKIEAFSAASAILMQQATHAQGQIMQFASDAVKAATLATLASAHSTTPASMVETQCRATAKWFEQMASNLMAISMLALEAHEAAMLPIRKTIASNSERLGT